VSSCLPACLPLPLSLYLSCPCRDLCLPVYLRISPRTAPQSSGVVVTCTRSTTSRGQVQVVQEGSSRAGHPAALCWDLSTASMAAACPRGGLGLRYGLGLGFGARVKGACGQGLGCLWKGCMHSLYVLAQSHPVLGPKHGFCGSSLPKRCAGVQGFACGMWAACQCCTCAGAQAWLEWQQPTQEEFGLRLVRFGA
jgi:hypothetical protein